MKKMLLGLSLVTSLAQATSLHPDTFRQVSSVLRPIPVTEVGAMGKVLKTRRHHPFTNFTIGVPVQISTENACTSFVGQTTNRQGRLLTLTPMGASNPLAEACIAVMPRPVNAMLTFEMKILTGGFVPAQPIQKQVVQLHGLGAVLVTLDMGNERVTIAPVGVRN